MKIFSRRFFFVAAFMLGLSACTPTGTAFPTPTRVDIGGLQTAAVQTYVADLTLSAPTETPLPSETPTPLPTTTPTLTPTSTPTMTQAWTIFPMSQASKDYVVYYLVDPIESVTSCDYNSIPFLAYPQIAKTGDYETDITNALRVLFSNRSASYDRFANPVSKSNLQVTDFSVEGITLHIHLGGTLHRNFAYPMTFEYSKFCPDSQTRDQIFKTAWQFRDTLAENGITDMVIWYYGDLLDDLLLNDFPAKP